MEQRKIIFKAKNLINGSWVEGDLLHGFTDKIIIRDKEFISHDVDPSTVCQFTGRYAENHVPIYEGDIVECTYFNEQGDDTHVKGTVTWETDVWGYVLKNFGFYEENPLYEGYDYIELPCTDDTESTIKVLYSKFDKEVDK